MRLAPVPGIALVLSLCTTFGTFAAGLPPGNRPAGPTVSRLSSAYERMLLDQMAAGRTLDEKVIRRFGLDATGADLEFAPADPDALSPPVEIPLGAGTALRPDAQVNNKSLDATCASGCSNRPLGQAETSIAVFGDFAIAGWNNTKGFCTGGAVQGYAYSIDGGATWTDAGDPPALPTGGRYRGDPVSAVNPTTGSFYILGLYEGGTPGSGLALARGHFSGGAFVIDDNRQIAIGGADFLDKEWMAVDPVSGNLYVTYTNFLGGSVGRIEMIRSTDNGLTWSAPVALNAPAADNLVQGSRPIVGPGGELYVVWYEFGVPLSHMRIRRSDDLGVTFGAERTVCDFYENDKSGAPGFRRGFGINLPSVAIDNSTGPFRGRLYVSWAESVNYFDAPLGYGVARSEIENNGFFASATPFTVGDVLRGAFSATSDVDLYRFSGLRGQTLSFVTDSATAGSSSHGMRIVCASDTAGPPSTQASYRYLAFSQATFTQIVFTLPATGTYYLRLNHAGGAVQTYRVVTGFDTPSSGERARDHRDAFVASSDDGTSWTTPVRIVDSDPWFDSEYPEIAVDGEGAAHCFWHDFRDDGVCGAESYEYLVSSGDGGASWGPNRRLSDVRSFWSFNVCGSANHGDYQGIAADGLVVHALWADSRLGDTDVWSEADRFGLGAACAGEIFSAAGSIEMPVFTLANPGNVSGDFEWELIDSGGWLTGVTPSGTGTTALAAGGSLPITATVQLPGSCPTPVTDTLVLVVRDLNIPGRSRTCQTVVHCLSSTGVAAAAPALFFASPRPTPSPRGASLNFGLSQRGPVRLTIFAANGARVRTLVSETRDPGEHRVLWDGRDARGHRLAAGVYFAALEAEGRSLRRPLVVTP